MVGRKAPLRYTLDLYDWAGNYAVVGRKAPLRYTDTLLDDS